MSKIIILVFSWLIIFAFPVPLKAQYLSDGKTRLHSVQRELQSSGYDVEVNGVFDGNTREALRQYQGDNNLGVNGRIDNETLFSMGLTTPDRAPASVPIYELPSINQDEDLDIKDGESRTGVSEQQERTGITEDQSRTGVDETF